MSNLDAGIHTNFGWYPGDRLVRTEKYMRLSMDINDCSESDIITTVTDASKHDRGDLKNYDPLSKDRELDALFVSEIDRNKKDLRDERIDAIKGAAKFAALSFPVFVGVQTALYTVIRAAFDAREKK